MCMRHIASYGTLLPVRARSRAVSRAVVCIFVSACASLVSLGDPLLVHRRLGIPYWSTGENDSFWETLYLKIKRRIANWKQLKFLSIIGRALLANFMIFSVPRYWVQTMAAPGWFHQALQADVYQLLWEREPTFEAEYFGTDSNSYKWIKNHTAPITPKGGASLGIGLLDWSSHVKAMQVKFRLCRLGTRAAGRHRDPPRARGVFF